MSDLFGQQTEVRRADPSAGRRRNQARYRGAGRDWETPWDLFLRLNEEFQFTLDPCATDKTAKCACYFTEKQDGLAQDWRGHRVFMNPPYGGELYLWTRKAKDSGALVVGLLPASTDTAWFHENVLEAEAEIRYIRGRVRFKVGAAWASPFAPNIIVIWKPKRTEVPA